jgi:hypothetical protein
VKLLVENGVELTAADNREDIALHTAVGQDYEYNLKLVLDDC